MRATGIVRRIDDMGRVVIPKEVRKVLRIREGDPLEIFIDGDAVVFKKYETLGHLTNFASEYVQALHSSLDCIVLISDIDKVIAVAGAPKKNYLDKLITPGFLDLLGRQTITRRVDPNATEIGFFKIVDDIEEKKSVVAASIMTGGEVQGAVVIICDTIDEIHIKLAETAASFLGKQLEE